MGTDDIINAITNIFTGTDERDWNKVKCSFADDVLLDYSSMNHNPAAVLPAADIIKAWEGFLPGFDLTRHQISGFKVEQNGGTATVHFIGKADHYIGEDSWTVEGTYDTELERSGNKWKLTKFKFNLQKQNGNIELPRKAAEMAGKNK